MSTEFRVRMIAAFGSTGFSVQRYEDGQATGSFWRDTTHTPSARWVKRAAKRARKVAEALNEAQALIGEEPPAA